MRSRSENELRSITDVNDRNQIVGGGRTFDGPPFTTFGYRFDRGETIDLGLLDHPLALNNVDQVVGFSGALGQDKAFLWDGGALVNLHEHPDLGGVTSRAWDINDAGLITGEAQFDISEPEQPAVWIDGEPFPLVPELARPQGVATGVTSQGWVTGYYNDLDDLGSGFRGFLWRDGDRLELFDLLIENDGWEQLLPYDINDRGEIVGGGVRNGELGHGFLMIPLAER